MADCQSGSPFGQDQLDSVFGGLFSEGGWSKDVEELVFQESGIFCSVSDEQGASGFFSQALGLQPEPSNMEDNFLCEFPLEYHSKLMDGATIQGELEVDNSTSITWPQKPATEFLCSSVASLNNNCPPMAEDSSTGLEHIKQVLFTNEMDEGDHIGISEGDVERGWQDFLQGCLETVSDFGGIERSAPVSVSEEKLVGLHQDPKSRDGLNVGQLFETAITGNMSEKFHSVAVYSNNPEVQNDEDFFLSSLEKLVGTTATSPTSGQHEIVPVGIPLLAPGTLERVMNEDHFADRPSTEKRCTIAVDSNCFKRGLQSIEAEAMNLEGQSCGFVSREELHKRQAAPERPQKRHQQSYKSCKPLRGMCTEGDVSQSGSERSEDKCRVDAPACESDGVGSDCTSEGSGQGKRSFLVFANSHQEQLPNNRKNDQNCAVVKSIGDGHGGADDVSKREIRLIRNRNSALESRRRKKSYISDLEGKCRAMEAQVNQLRQVASITAMENGVLRDQLSHFHRYFSHVALPGTSFAKPSSVTPQLPSMEAVYTQIGDQAGDGDVANGAAEKATKDAVITENGTSGDCKKKGRGRSRKYCKSSAMAEPAVLESDSLPPESLPFHYPCLSLLTLCLFLLPLCYAGIFLHLVFHCHVFPNLVFRLNPGHVRRHKSTWKLKWVKHYVRPPSLSDSRPWKYGSAFGACSSGALFPAGLHIDTYLGENLSVKPNPNVFQHKMHMGIEEVCGNFIARRYSRLVASAA